MGKRKKAEEETGVLLRPEAIPLTSIYSENFQKLNSVYKMLTSWKMDYKYFCVCYGIS